MADDLRIAPVALDLAWNDPEKNLELIDGELTRRLERAQGPSEAHLFLFPELTLTGFVTQDPKILSLDHPAVKELQGLAAKHKTALVAGFPERAEKAKPRNAAVLIDPGGRIAASYRKLHLFTLGRSPESAHYDAGDAGLIVDYRGWKLAFAICFDIRFSRLFHEYARAGADAILVPSCWVGGPHKSEQYRTLNSAHAILTQAYVAAVNRSGKDPFYEYDGSEYVFSPFGEQLYRGAAVRLDRAELDKARSLAVRPSDRADYPLRPPVR